MGGGGGGGRPPSARANPFAMPSDAEIFHRRDVERARAKERRVEQGRLKVWEKSNTGKALSNRKKDLMAEIERAEAEAAAGGLGGPGAQAGSGAAGSRSGGARGGGGVKLPAVKGSATSADIVREQRRKEKENTREFIAKKREMFLIQMSLDTKRSEIKKLEELATQREALLRKNEKMLEEDALRFDAFLKDNDVLAVDAMKRAEEAARGKQEKLAEIKKLNAQINAIRSDMGKAEDKLKHCAEYKKFLDGLTPPEWIEEQTSIKRARQAERRRARRAARAAARRAAADRGAADAAGDGARDLAGYGSFGGDPDAAAEAAAAAAAAGGGGAAAAEAVDDNAADPDVDSDEGYSSGEEIPMYFTDPQQLLDIFTALEEKNLFLIQNSQETEEALEELKQNFRATRERMDEETAQLRSQIQRIQAQIAKEEARMSSLTSKGKRLGAGTDREAVLKDLHERVSEVYEASGFDTRGLSILEMLTSIEGKLESLLSVVAHMDPREVHEAEKAREKHRRQRAREEKLENQKIAQELRLKKSLERSKAPVQKRTGKPVMFRSKPVARKKKDQDSSKKTADEEEDIREFFMA